MLTYIVLVVHDMIPVHIVSGLQELKQGDQDLF
jgi:hypothetical protein